MRHLFLLLSLLWAFSSGSGRSEAAPLCFPQERATEPRKVDSLDADASFQTVFERVEQAMRSGEWAPLEELFAEHVSMSVERRESGYVSALQAVSILNAFHVTHKPIGFSFSRISDAAPNPFATGRLQFGLGGTRKSAQVYVALSQTSGGWRISHVSIYR
jgi:hypothetical protein